MPSTSETIQSARPMIETPDQGVIQQGGASSSELLTALQGAITDDVVELDRRTRDTGEQVGLANTVFAAQLTALTTRLASLEARLPSASGRWMADFFTNDYVDAASTALISTVYGQATLPILSSQEKLVGSDTRGAVWIPEGAMVHYSYAAGTPNEVDWLRDDRALYALDQRSDTAWWRNRDTSGNVWVRIRVPANLNANKLANCIILHPYPALTNDLLSVEYRDPAGIWTGCDLTYLLGWSQAQSRVQGMGNVRLWIPESQVTEIRVKLSAQGIWGFQKLSLRQVEFSPTATLVVNFQQHNPGALGSAVVSGKDSDALSYLSKTITNASPPAGPTVAVPLAQNTQNSSPVITAIEARK